MLGRQTCDILWQINFIIHVKCVHMSENVCMCVCLLGTGPSWSREDGLGAVNAADFHGSSGRSVCYGEELLGEVC